MSTWKTCLAALALTGLASGAAAESLKMATIAPGSSAYLTMSTMATLVNQGQDSYDITVDATGAATRHMVSLAEGELDQRRRPGSLAGAALQDRGLARDQREPQLAVDVGPELEPALEVGPGRGGVTQQRVGSGARGRECCCHGRCRCWRDNGGRKGALNAGSGGRVDQGIHPLRRDA